MRFVLCIAVLAALLASPATAAFNLQITEIWPGNAPDENLTDDWFEVTNFGDAAWTTADGVLYFDDTPPDATAADALFGVTSIGPGESVVFVDGNPGTGGLNEALWHSIWDAPILAAGRTIPQVGSYNGSGLGQGGDGVALYLDSNGGDVAAGDLIDLETYPDANNNGGQSYDPTLLAFTPAGLGISTVGSDLGQPAIGTPGFLAPVPEPTSLALTAFTLALVGRRRR